MSSSSIVMTKMLLLLFRLFVIIFISLRVSSHYLFKFRGAPKMDMTAFRPLKQLIKPRELAKLLLSPIKQV